MPDTDLAFHTTAELIAELMRRRTFLGLVIQSDDELKHCNWQGERVFKVHLNDNLDRTEAGRLLEVVAARLDRHCC